MEDIKGYSWETGPGGDPRRISVGVPSRKGVEGASGVESRGECGGGDYSQHKGKKGGGECWKVTMREVGQGDFQILGVRM